VLFILEQSLSSRSSQSAVRRRWLSFCTVWPSHSQWPSEQIRQCPCPFYSSRAGLFGKASHHPGLSAPYSPYLAPCDFWIFPKLKLFLKRRRFVKCDGHTIHMLSQRRLTADWLAPRESDCSRIHSKVCSGWLPSCIKATRPVLEIFKMDRYSPDSLRIKTYCWRQYIIKYIYLYIQYINNYILLYIVFLNVF